MATTSNVGNQNLINSLNSNLGNVLKEMVDNSFSLGKANNVRTDIVANTLEGNQNEAVNPWDVHRELAGLGGNVNQVI